MPRKNKDKVICLRVDEETHAELMSAKKLTKSPISNLIRLCIQAELKTLKEKYGQGVTE